MPTPDFTHPEPVTHVTEAEVQRIRQMQADNDAVNALPAAPDQVTFLPTTPPPDLVNTAETFQAFINRQAVNPAWVTATHEFVTGQIQTPPEIRERPSFIEALRILLREYEQDTRLRLPAFRLADMLASYVEHLSVVRDVGREDRTQAMPDPGWAPDPPVGAGEVPPAGQPLLVNPGRRNPNEINLPPLTAEERAAVLATFAQPPPPPA